MTLQGFGFHEKVTGAPLLAWRRANPLTNTILTFEKKMRPIIFENLRLFQ